MASFDPVFAAPGGAGANSAQARGQAIRNARAMRVRTIRRRVVAGAVALFLAAWGLIAVVLVTGHDPALAKSSNVAAATSSGGTSNSSSGSAGVSTSSGSSGSTSNGSSSSSSGNSGTSSGNSGTSSVTTRQS